MGASFSLTRIAARRLIGSALAIVAVGCAADGLLLPVDGAPAQLRAVSGDRQSAPAGTPVRDPLVVEALDRAGRPVVGAVILFEFTGPADGAQIAPPSSATDSVGQASVQVTLGTPVGYQPVEARAADAADLRVQFQLTALQPDPVGDGDGGDGEGDEGGGDEGGGDEGGGDEGGGDEGSGGGSGSEGNDGGGNDGGNDGGEGEDGGGNGGGGDGDGDDEGDGNEGSGGGGGNGGGGEGGSGNDGDGDEGHDD
jgi:hypothetical protein